MPRKGKGKKAAKGGGSSPVVEIVVKDEMALLEEQIARLKEELSVEQSKKCQFEGMKESMQALWQSRNRIDKDEEECHQLEINDYKKRMKHALFDQHVTIGELKIDSVVSSSLMQNKGTEAELGLWEEIHTLQEDSQEMDHYDQSYIKNMKLKHHLELVDLTNHLDRKRREIEVKHLETMKSLKEAEIKRTHAEISKLDEEMKELIEGMSKKQNRAFREAEEHYTSSQINLLANQRVLRQEVAELKKQQELVEKKIVVAQRKKENLEESLQKLPELRRQLDKQNQARSTRKVNEARVRAMEQELRDVSAEHVQLWLAFEEVQQEHDQLLKKQNKAIMDLQQRSGLKEMLLEKKVAVLTETLARREAQLSASTTSSNTDKK